jgi:hypothetical protein
LDASLEKVLPGVHQWHKITNESISRLTTNVNDLKSELKGEMENLFSTVVASKEDSKVELAKVHMAIALQLMQGGVGEVNADNISQLSNLSRTMAQPTMRSSDTTSTIITTDTPAGTSEDVGSIEPAALEVNKFFRMKAKHSSLTGLMKEWLGLGEFADPLGGIQGRIDKYKSTTKWRKQCMIHPQHFSRTMRSVKAVEEFARQQGIDKMSAALELEEAFSTCDKSVAAFVLWTQSSGLIAKRSSRGKTSGSKQ